LKGVDDMKRQNLYVVVKELKQRVNADKLYVSNAIPNAYIYIKTWVEGALNDIEEHIKGERIYSYNKGRYLTYTELLEVFLKAFECTNICPTIKEEVYNYLHTDTNLALVDKMKKLILGKEA
jgi:hypothetical protein